MIHYNKAKGLLLAAVLPWTAVLTAQQSAETRLGENAALRYWSAFAQMRDSSVSPAQAKELQAILEGTAPYYDLKHRDLVERNRLAVETLQRGAELSNCDWGLEYQLGSEAPIEHVRKALALGRLNVLYSMHQLQTGDRSGGIRTLSRGIRFSHDVSAGGPLIAALAGKTLLVSHLRLVAFAAVEKALSASEKALISSALSRIGAEGVDWQAAIRREFEVLARSGSPAPATVEEHYQRALQDPKQLPHLQKAIASTPKAVAGRIINPQRVLDQKRELDERLRAAHLSLRE
ncbi:MAG: hypothetical protein NTY38_27390 [Acidobacteria bacterium]|nr:hypothetical protein [Acidobacteriota bacterium]